MEELIPKERFLIIKNYREGMTMREIGDALDIPYTKAHYWINRHKTYGMEGLKTKKQPGKKPLLSEKEITKIKEFLVNNKPMRYKGQASGWNSREVKNHIKQKFNVSYSLRHVERLLHKFGFSLITPRPKNIKSSAEKQKAFRENFKKNSEKNMWVYQ